MNVIISLLLIIITILISSIECANYISYNPTTREIINSTYSINIPEIKFDVSIDDDTSLMITVNDYIYFLARKGQNQLLPNYYVYSLYQKHIEAIYPHQIIQDNIYLPGISVKGFTLSPHPSKIQNFNQFPILEYIIGVETTTVSNTQIDTLYVMQVKQDSETSQTSQTFYYDYIITYKKKIGLDFSLLLNNVYVTDDLYYRVFIAGSFINQEAKSINNYFLASFRKDLNLTEWIKYGYTNTIAINNTITSVIAYPDLQMIYIFGVVNNNTFFGQFPQKEGISVSALVATSNVFVISHGYSMGTIQWVRILGDEIGEDTFISACLYGESILILQNSQTGKYNSGLKNTTDILYTRLRAETGQTIIQMIYGNNLNNAGLSIAANHQGIFLLVKYTPGLQPHPLTTSFNIYTWAGLGGATDPNATTIGVIYMGWNNRLLDLEVFNIEKNYQYPSLLILQVDKSNFQNQMVFLSHVTIPGGGLAITSATENSFANQTNTANNCVKSTAFNSSSCVICKSSTIFYNHECHLTCPDFTRKIDYGLSGYCYPCHHSCYKCDASKNYSRMGCDSCNSLKNFQTKSNWGCVCSDNYVEYGETCQSSSCSGEFSVLNEKKICSLQCPYDSLKYFNFLSETADYDIKRTSSINSTSDCSTDQYFMVFKNGYSGLKLPSPPISEMPLNWTCSFWIFLNGALPINKQNTILWAFDQFKIYRKITTPYQYFTLSLTFSSLSIETEIANSNKIPEYYLNSSESGIWIYVAAAKRYISSNGTNEGYLIFKKYSSTVYTKLVLPTGTKQYLPRNFIPYMVLAGDIVDYTQKLIDSTSFSCAIKDLKLFNQYLNINYMLNNNIFRLNTNLSIENQYMIAYWRLNSSYGDLDLTTTIIDTSKYNQNITVNTYNNLNNANGQGGYPLMIDWNTYKSNFTFNPAPSLIQSCLTRDLYQCLYFGPYNITNIIPSGEWLDNPVESNIWQDRTYFDPSKLVNQDPDKQYVTWYAGDTLSLTKYSCNNLNETTPKKTYQCNTDGKKCILDYISTDTVYFRNLKSGYYEVCYTSITTTSVFNIGQVYINSLQNLISFQPDNAAPTQWYYGDQGIKYSQGQSWKIRLEGYGDLSEGDQIYLALYDTQKGCFEIARDSFDNNGLLNKLNIVYSQATGWSDFILSQNLQITPGKYIYCYRPVYSNRVFNPIDYTLWTFQGAPKVNPAAYTWHTIPTANTIDLTKYAYQLLAMYYIDFFVGGGFYPGDELLFSNNDDKCAQTNILGKLTYQYNDWPLLFFGYNLGIPLSTAAITIGTPSYYTLYICYRPIQTIFTTSNSALNTEMILFDSYTIEKVPIKVISTQNPQNYPEIVSYYPLTRYYGLRVDSDLSDNPTVQVNMPIYSTYYYATQNPGRLSCFKLDWDILANIWKPISDVKYWNCKFTERGIYETSIGDCSPYDNSASTAIISTANQMITMKYFSFSSYINYLYVLFPTSFRSVSSSPSAPYYLFGPSTSNDIIPNNFKLYVNLIDFKFILQNPKIYPASTSFQFGYKDTGPLARWTTKWMKLALYINGSSDTQCNYPGGTKIPRGNVDSWDSSMVYIKNLNLNGCQTGTLWGNLTILRVIYADKSPLFTQYRLLYRDEYLLANIGCDDSCLTCNGTGKYSCVLCPYGYKNNKGACVDTCPTGIMNPIQIINTVNNIADTLITCVSECPDGKYLDSLNTCKECPSSCKTCKSADITDCLSCYNNKYLLNGYCLDACPDKFTKNMITNNCDSIYTNASTTSNTIKVNITSNLYKSRANVNKIIELKAYIYDPLASVNNIQWKHIEKQTDLGNSIFIDDPTNQSYATINMTKFLHFSPTVAITIVCLVSNTYTTVADSIDIYVNFPPSLGIFSITPTYGQSLYTKFTIQCSGWIDTADDLLIGQLQYRVEYELPGDLSNERYTLVNQQVSNNKILSSSIIFPIIDKAANAMINIYLIVIDNYLGTTEATTQVNIAPPYSTNSIYQTINNDYNITNGWSTITTLSDVYIWGLIINSIFRSYGTEYPVNFLCIDNYGCSGNGICITFTTYSYCACNAGFGGIQCQFSESLLSKAESVNYKALQVLTNKIALIATNVDVRAVSQYLCLITQHTSLITNTTHLSMAIKLFQKIVNVSLTIAPSLDELTKIYLLNASSGLINTLFLQLKKENSISYRQDQYANLSKTQINALILNKTLTRQNNFELIWNSTRDLLNTLAYLASPSEMPFEIITNIFHIKLICGLTQDIINDGIVSISLDFTEGYMYIPSQLFANKQSIAFNMSLVHIKMIHFIQNPFQFYQNYTEAYTDMYSITFIDSHGDELSLNNLNHLIDIYIPWSYNYNSGINPEFLTCAWWNSQNTIDVNTSYVTLVNSSSLSADELKTKYNFVANTSVPWILINVTGYKMVTKIMPIFSSSGCNIISYDNANLICRCNHLTEFAGIRTNVKYMTDKVIISEYLTKFDPSINWSKTIGFYIILTTASLYIILAFILWASEQNTLQKYEIKWLKTGHKRLTKMKRGNLTKSSNPNNQRGVLNRQRKGLNSPKELKSGIINAEHANEFTITQYHTHQQEYNDEEAQKLQDIPGDNETKIKMSKSKKGEIIKDKTQSILLPNPDGNMGFASDYDTKIPFMKSNNNTEDDKNSSEKMNLTGKMLDDNNPKVGGGFSGNSSTDSNQEIIVLKKRSKETILTLKNIQNHNLIMKGVNLTKGLLGKQSNVYGLNMQNKPSGGGLGRSNGDRNDNSTSNDKDSNDIQDKNDLDNSKRQLMFGDILMTQKNVVMPGGLSSSLLDISSERNNPTIKIKNNISDDANKQKGEINLTKADDDIKTRKIQELTPELSKSNTKLIKNNEAAIGEIINAPDDDLLGIKEKTLVKSDDVNVNLDDKDNSYFNLIKEFETNNLDISENSLKHESHNNRDSDNCMATFIKILTTYSILISLFKITSIILPKHIRITLLTIDILLHMLFLTLVYTLIKAPYIYPLENESLRQLQTADMIYGSYSALIISMLMYVIFWIFKPSEYYINNAYTPKLLERAINKTKKQAKIRFAIGYIISTLLLSITGWYVIVFSYKYGWGVSYSWLYSLLLGLGFDLIVLTIFGCLVQIICMKFPNRITKLVLKIRRIKQISMD